MAAVSSPSCVPPPPSVPHPLSRVSGNDRLVPCVPSSSVSSRLDGKTKSFLVSHTIGDLIGKKENKKSSLLAVHPCTTLSDCLLFLESNNIIACPIIEKKGESPIISELIEINEVVPSCSDISKEEAQLIIAKSRDESTERMDGRIGTFPSSVTDAMKMNFPSAEETEVPSTKMEGRGGKEMGVGTEELSKGEGVKEDVMERAVINQTQYRYIGIVSILSLIKPIIMKMNNIGGNAEEFIEKEKERKEAVNRALSSGESGNVLNEPVSNCVESTHQQGNRILSYKQNLLELLEYFAENLWGLSVYKEEEFQPIRLEWLSQMDFFRYLNRNKEQLGEAVKRKVMDIGAKEGEMVQLKYNNQSAIEAFRLLFSAPRALCAIPIVNERDEMIGNLSASDMRGISMNNVDLLLLPVLEYLKVCPSNQKRQSEIFLLTVNPSDPLETAIKEVVENDIHRVWISNEKNQVIGCCSLTDMARGML